MGSCRKKKKRNQKLQMQVPAKSKTAQIQETGILVREMGRAAGTGQDRNKGIRECGGFIRSDDRDERTFRLSFSSEEPYNRWFGPEILDHTDGCVDFSRLNSNPVVLFNHNRDVILGRINRAWVENGRGEAEITFDADDEAEKICKKVKSGTLKGVSVGYLVDSWEEVMPNKQSSDGRFTGPCSIAKRWTPYEISIVSVPADPTVGIGRSDDSGTRLRQLQYKQLLKEELKMTREQMLARMNEILTVANDRAMTAEEQAEFDRLKRSVELMDLSDTAGAGMSGQGSRAKGPKDDGDGDVDGSDGDGSDGDHSDSSADDDDEKKAKDAAKKALAAERLRVRQIHEMCRSFGIDPREFLDNGDSVEKVRAAVLDQLIQSGAPIRSGVRVTDDEGDKFRRAATDALIMRSGMDLERPADGARNFMGMQFRDLAIECLQMDGCCENGLNRRGSDELYAMLQRSFFTPESTFPAILDNTIEKAYREGHKKASVTFDRITKKGTLSDFQIHNNYYIAGPVGEFLEVPESGELKHDVFRDDHLPTRQLRTYGRQFTLSRKAFIDDDIGLVTSLPARYAASARKTINKQVYSILVNNPAIYDGVPLFHSAHKNLLKTGTGVTQEAMQTMIMALANQRDQFGEAIIINPAILVVPSGMQFDMYTLFNSPAIHTTENTQAVNPLYQYRDQLEVVEDPTINSLCGGMGNVMPWWLLGAAGDTEFIEVDYLNGQEIPNIRRMETPGQLGFVWDLYLDWGISVMDFRGGVKNPGVEVKTKLELA